MAVVLPPRKIDTVSVVQQAGSVNNPVVNTKDGDNIGFSNFSAKVVLAINAEDWRERLGVAQIIPLGPNMPLPAEIDGTAPTDLTGAAKLTDLIELYNKLNRLISQLSVNSVVDPRPSVFSKGDVADVNGGTAYDIRQLFVFPYEPFRNFYVTITPSNAGTVEYLPGGVDSVSTMTAIRITLVNATASNVVIRCYHRTADLIADPYAQATVTINSINAV